MLLFERRDLWTDDDFAYVHRHVDHASYVRFHTLGPHCCDMSLINVSRDLDFQRL